MSLKAFNITVYLDEKQLQELDAYIESRVEKPSSRWTCESALAVLAAVGLETRTDDRNRYRKLQEEIRVPL